MADLFSNYSESAAAHPPLDRLAPKPVSFAGKQATAVQDDGAGELPRGRTVITVNFANPTQNEDSLDSALRKGPAGEGDVQADLTYDPVVVGTEAVFAAADRYQPPSRRVRSEERLTGRPRMAATALSPNGHSP